MRNQDFINLKVARNLIIEVITIARTTREKLLYQEIIPEEEFNKIFEEVEIPLCRIADKMAIIINQELLTPVTSCQQEFESVCNELKSALQNHENPHILISKLNNLTTFFDTIVCNQNIYPDTSTILSDIKYICNQY
ncbi:hypothetical protein GNE08_19335 [Trichormus variabilis ARAD]|nr:MULTISPECIES: hypothetical protein [Nostocaceae]MBC1216371.1 hypothetical protein [Trichormus variabilis ARAD]MBC1305151.1 hypothetical protein [Trichormus variabilis N2B]MBC1310292.1 hypothetical protein [Trichormus variabilis PNB]MBC1325284.1 hypothetical protein [Trichormus variabilis 9RC]MBD2381598.1 hypothetical protein [Trichormus variabilis FACHB-319]